MKARFFAIAALVLGLASCAKDFAPEANFGGEVDFTLAVSAPELAATRAGEYGEDDFVNGHNSAYGAIDYLSDAEWEKVDLRYTLEVYDVADNYTNAKPIKDRQVKFVDKYEGVTFETRLAPNRNYRFVVFADFVEEEKVTNDPAIEAQRTIGMRHDIGDNLTQITIKEDDINDEYADAYFGTLDFNPTNNVANKVEKPMILTRPYAKMRVVATDLHELNLNVDPGSVKVVYTAYHPNTFNAVNGDISGEYVKEYYDEDYPKTLTKENLSSYMYTEYYEEKTTTSADGYVRHTHMTLFTDYILATDTQKPIQFTMLVCDKEGNPIKETAFNTEIPVQRNHLTTIIGNVLTTATEVEVTIDDNFANADNQNWVFEAFVNGGEVTLDQNYTIGSTLFVESGVEAVLNLNGKTIKNTKGNQLTDVIVVKEGGKLTINGNGSIEAVNGNDGYAVISEGELIINGGTYTSGVDANGESNAIIYARGNGKVYVNGGFFNRNGSSNDGSFALNKKDSDRATTVIEVRGGKFRKFNPENNAAEGAGTNFLAPGYGVIEYAPNYYEVVSMVTVYNADEFTAAAADESVKYMRFGDDINFGTSYAPIRTDKVIYGNGYTLTAGGHNSKNYAVNIYGNNVVVYDLNIDGGGFYLASNSSLVANNCTIADKPGRSGRNTFFVSANATATINNCTCNIDRTSCYFVYAAAATSACYINGGDYSMQLTNKSDSFVNGATSKDATIAITAGTFNVNPTNWLADGYQAVYNSTAKTWTVSAI